MSRRGLLFAVLFSAVAAGVVWDRANLGLVRRDAAVAERPLNGGADPDEIVLEIGGTHPLGTTPPRPAAPPRSPRPEAEVERGVRRPGGRAAAAPAPATRTCRVAPGETLRKIAGRELGNPERWSEIAALNGIADPRHLRSGAEIAIPAD